VIEATVSWARLPFMSSPSPTSIPPPDSDENLSRVEKLKNSRKASEVWVDNWGNIADMQDSD